MGTVVQLELFTVSAVDPPWRDNRDAMEFPFLSLQKKRIRPIEYRAPGVHLSVAADSRFSIATIWDWDLVIFAASHPERGDRNRPPAVAAHPRRAP
jgi:plasmid replication initiation protein